MEQPARSASAAASARVNAARTERRLSTCTTGERDISRVPSHASTSPSRLRFRSETITSDRAARSSAWSSRTA